MAAKPLPTETEVVQHAEIAARYYRALVDEAVPLTQAAVMASMYLAGLLARHEEQPQEPWEREAE